MATIITTQMTKNSGACMFIPGPIDCPSTPDCQMRIPHDAAATANSKPRITYRCRFSGSDISPTIIVLLAILSDLLYVIVVKAATRSK
jgi:hypothetical protein